MDVDRNLVKYKHDFIVAGVKTSLKSFYDSLIKLGATPCNALADTQRIRENKPFVILCKREFTLTKGVIFNRIQVLSHDWWDYYHNKRKNPNSHIPTYNLPKQWKEVEKLLITKEVPLLIPEEA